MINLMTGAIKNIKINASWFRSIFYVHDNNVILCSFSTMYTFNDIELISKQENKSKIMTNCIDNKVYINENSKHIVCNITKQIKNESYNAHHIIKVNNKLYIVKYEGLLEI